MLLLPRSSGALVSKEHANDDQPCVVNPPFYYEDTGDVRPECPPVSVDLLSVDLMSQAGCSECCKCFDNGGGTIVIQSLLLAGNRLRCKNISTGQLPSGVLHVSLFFTRVSRSSDIFSLGSAYRAPGRPFECAEISG